MVRLAQVGPSGHKFFPDVQPVYLGEFYHRGFGQTEEASALAAHPDQQTYNHYFDPRNGEAGLD